jgi:hypothetical protein
MISSGNYFYILYKKDKLTTGTNETVVMYFHSHSAAITSTFKITGSNLKYVYTSGMTCSETLTNGLITFV